MDHFSSDFLMDGSIEHLYFFIFFHFPYLLTFSYHHLNKINPIPSKIWTPRMSSLDLLSGCLLGFLCRQCLLDNSWTVCSGGFFLVCLHSLSYMLFSFESWFNFPEAFPPSLYLINFYSSFKPRISLPQGGLLLTLMLGSLLYVLLSPFPSTILTFMMSGFLTPIFSVRLYHLIFLTTKSSIANKVLVHSMHLYWFSIAA